MAMVDLANATTAPGSPMLSLGTSILLLSDLSQMRLGACTAYQHEISTNDGDTRPQAYSRVESNSSQWIISKYFMTLLGNGSVSTVSNVAQPSRI